MRVRDLERKYGLSWSEVEHLYQTVKVIQQRKTNVIQLKSQTRKKVAEKLLSKYNLPYTSLRSSTHSIKIEKYTCEKFISIVQPIYSKFRQAIEIQNQERILLTRRILSSKVPDVRALYQTFTGDSKSEQSQNILDCLKEQGSLYDQVKELLNSKITSMPMLIYSEVDWTFSMGLYSLRMTLSFNANQRYHFLPLFTPITDILSSNTSEKGINSIIIENMDTAVSCIHNSPIFNLVISAGGNAITGSTSCNILSKIAQELPSSLYYFADFDPEGLRIFKSLKDRLEDFHSTIDFYVPKNVDLVEIATLFGKKLTSKSREAFKEQLVTIDNKNACNVIEKMLEANSTLEQNILLYIDTELCNIEDKWL